MRIIEDFGKVNENSASIPYPSLHKPRAEEKVFTHVRRENRIRAEKQNFS